MRASQVVVPGSADALKPNWLTTVLCAELPGARVVACSVSGGSDGTSSRRELHVKYNEAGAGLPTRFFVKSVATVQQRLLVGVTGITAGESEFYNNLRPTLDLRSPTAAYAGHDRITRRSMLIMPDLAAAGWTFPDPLHDPRDQSDTHDMIEQLATFHARFWRANERRPALDLPSPLRFQQRLNRRLAYRYFFERGAQRTRHLMPPRLRSDHRRMWGASMEALRINEHLAPTLLHQDPHPGNWLRDLDGRLGLYDWQCVAYGGWALDVAYALVLGLEPEDRAAWLPDLITQYLDELRSRGVADAPTYDAALLAVRQQLLHALLFLIPAAGIPAFLDQVQPADYQEMIIARCYRGVEELDSIAAVG